LNARRIAVAAACLAGGVPLAFSAAAPAHPERPAYFPVHEEGKRPVYRSNGPKLVVCKEDSKARIAKLPDRKMRAKNRRLLKQCRFRHIQAAVDAAKSGYRILILPGVYREEPTRDKPEPDPRCKDMYTSGDQPDALSLGGLISKRPSKVPNYEYQYYCPNAQNLIAIIGDDPKDADRKCDHRCNLQIEGMARRQDVLIDGSRKKLNVIRGDRADGLYLRNFTVQYSDFNNIYALETNGFVFSNIESRYSREYGLLTFVSDNGLYHNIDAHGSGDSGVYPGAGPEGHCKWYGIEIRYVDSHHNNLGYSGTAGNGVWVHHSKFRNNGTGIATDSFVPGHPGMPQDCAKWEDNEIYSNNMHELFTKEHQKYCRETPWEKRDPTKVCSTFQNPTGTGLLIAGGNSNVFRRNRVYDNDRYGVMLLHVPATARGEDDPNAAQDTSHENQFVANLMSVGPDGKRSPNGVDFWWSEQGKGNCWAENIGPKGPGDVTGDPSALPGCPGSPFILPGNQVKLVSQVPCAMWDPNDPDMDTPPGCDWMTPPKKPQ
jgi:hypothetical protein